MKIFSEVRAESEAKKFEEILMGVIKECADDEYSRKLALFSKKNIYPKYINALSDAWREDSTPIQNEIEEFFENIRVIL